MRTRFALALSLAAALWTAGARAEKPDVTAFVGGKIFTADPRRPWATAIAVRGDAVLSVGDDDRVLKVAGKDARVFDLQGRTVVPGINDAHLHVTLPRVIYLNSPAFVPGPGPTLQEVTDLLSSVAGQVPPGAWLAVLIGTNVLDDPNATRFALDAVSPQNPVWLQGWAGHGTVINTQAMQALGLRDDEPDPFGGTYGRLDGTQTLNGQVHEYAEYRIWRALYATMTDAELIAQYQAAAAQAVQLGYTSWQDMAVGLPHERAVRVLKAANLPLRVREMCFQLEPGEGCALANEDSGVTASGIKWIADGTPIERGAYLDEDYQDRPGVRGRLDLPSAAMPDILAQALSGPPQRRQLLFHGVGDGAIEAILGSLESSGGGEVWDRRRTRIEHADLLFPENFARMRDNGAMVVQNARHLTLVPVWASRFAPAIFGQLEPLRSLLDLGIPLALGTDAIGQVASPWVDVMLAAIHPTHPAEALTVEQAITAFTAGSAAAEFEEHRKGSLAPGNVADLAVLSQDPFSAPLPALPATGSLLTMVGGQVVWDAGVLQPR
jgi:predicted amidohydrolase YtcJ